MSYTVEKLDKNMAKITIEVPAEEFEKAMTTSYNSRRVRFLFRDFVRAKCQWHF